MRRLLLAASAVCAGLAPVATPAPAAVPPIKHVFVIVLENHEFGDTFGLQGQLLAPYLNRTLVPEGQLLTQYYGVGHSSADNYIAMASGQPPTPSGQDDCPDYNGTHDPKPVPPDATAHNIATGDGCLYPDNFKTLGDQLTEKGLAWRDYSQDQPSPCFTGSSYRAPGSLGDYKRKHNPFILFQSIRESPDICNSSVVALPQTPEDLRAVLDAPDAPAFTYIVPNQCDDGHDDCTNPAPPVPIGADPVTADEVALTQIDGFLQKWVPAITQSNAMKDGLLVVTFDEAVENLSCCNEQPGPATSDPGNQAGIPGSGGGDSGAVLISPCITPGSADPTKQLNNTGYNHYSLLRSVEDLFGLSHLGYADADGLAPFGSDVYNHTC